MNLNNQINQKSIDRWDVIRFLYVTGYVGAGQRSIRLFLQERRQNYGEDALKDLLQDICDRGFCTIEIDADNLFHCKITPQGRDLHDYAIACPNTIARPPKPLIPNA